MRLSNPHFRPHLISPSASPEEGAAIVAALERFMRETSPTLAPSAPGEDPWREAAILEGVSRGPGESRAWGASLPLG